MSPTYVFDLAPRHYGVYPLLKGYTAGAEEREEK